MVSRPASREPSRRPAAVLAGTTAAYRPRLLAGAYSTRKADAPAYSPDAEKPWTTRTTRRRMGAQMPMELYPGIRAMQKVAPDMIRIDRERAVRRPTRSPMWPQTKPPSGRTRNEIAKRANVSRRAVWGLDSGKKTAAMVA